jgi:N-methylhydantoinase A
MSRSEPGWRVGIDTGGTFTDLVAVRGDDVRIAKVPSTPPRFDGGVLDALRAAELKPSQLELLAHATTATTNAVITKGGARTALLTTRGFRDVLELRRHNRGEIYNIMWDPPPPLVPRRWRHEVTERIDYAGEIKIPLDEDDVDRALLDLLAEGVEAVAVSFLHSYQNPEHEQRVKELVRRTCPELYISISSELIREPGEFERTSTTVVNAYLGPILAGYLGRLDQRLTEDGFDGTLLIMHSGGGLLPARSALEKPARTVTSGPAAGALAAAGLALEAAHVLSLDMGGTSADIAVIRDGKALLVNEYEPEFGMPIRFPAVDLLTIGAGGGSIAWVDAAGIPQVGPQSSGASPGPACYGRGGAEATVTDANLVLGRLAPETVIAGDLRLDPEPARAAVGAFAARLGLDEEAAALGIVEIANSNMERALRVMTVERGLDPRGFTLVPFGGAGPMHACELAEALQISRVLIPLAPGVTSALGTLFADVVHDVARTKITPIAQLQPGEIASLFSELEGEAQRALDADQVPAAFRSLERSLDLRYLGQLKTLSIAVGDGDFDSESVAVARRKFLDEYERRYRYVTDEIPVELAVVRVRGRGAQQPPRLKPEAARSAPAASAERRVRFRSGAAQCNVYLRADLPIATELPGPVIVEQPDSVIVVAPGWTLTVDERGNLELERAR